MRYQHQETRHTDVRFERRKGEAQLSSTMTKVFPSLAMRGSFLSQDRADLGEAVRQVLLLKC